MNIILNGKNYSLEENFTVQKLLKKLEEDWLLDLSGAVVLVNDEIVKKDRNRSAFFCIWGIVIIMFKKNLNIKCK